MLHNAMLPKCKGGGFCRSLHDWWLLGLVCPQTTSCTASFGTTQIASPGYVKKHRWSHWVPIQWMFSLLWRLDGHCCFSITVASICFQNAFKTSARDGWDIYRQRHKWMHNEANVNVRILIGLPATWQQIISADIHRFPLKVLAR